MPSQKGRTLAANVKQYQADKEEWETGSIANMQAVNTAELASVTEVEFQYVHYNVNGGSKMRIDSGVQSASGVFKQQNNNKTYATENSAFPQTSKKCI